jgi:hypothetical protein
VEIRHVRRRWSRGDNENMEVAGGIQVTGGVGSHPVGSYQLRHINSLVLGPATNMASGSATGPKRGIAGSVRDPMTTYGNSVRLRSFITGTTGTRLASIATIGSTAVAGAVSAPFIAYGH